jgi:uncharacterized protein YndB with AHSA1/START domain
MLKKLAFAVVAIVALFLLVAAILPGSYTVERSIVIARPPAVVFDQVADYNRWLEWSPWPKAEPTAKQTVTGEPGTVGMSWSWEGEQVGVGSMTLADVEENRSIHSKLVFEEPMQSEADDYVLLEPTEEGTKVTWRNTGDLPYPVGRYFGLGLEGMLGPQFEEGLASLKALCESQEEPEPAVEETTSQAAGAKPSDS